MNLSTAKASEDERSRHKKSSRRRPQITHRSIFSESVLLRLYYAVCSRNGLRYFFRLSTKSREKISLCILIQIVYYRHAGIVLFTGFRRKLSCILPFKIQSLRILKGKLNSSFGEMISRKGWLYFSLRCIHLNYCGHRHLPANAIYTND